MGRCLKQGPYLCSNKRARKVEGREEEQDSVSQTGLVHAKPECSCHIGEKACAPRTPIRPWILSLIRTSSGPLAENLIKGT